MHWVQFLGKLTVYTLISYWYIRDLIGLDCHPISVKNPFIRDLGLGLIEEFIEFIPVIE